MLVKYSFIIFLQLLLSYCALKFYTKISPIIIIKDEFTTFKRGKVIGGAGVVFLLVFNIFFFIYLLIFNFNLPEKFFIFLIAATVLGFLSLYDDYKNVDPIPRLIVQIICIYFSLATVPHIVNFLPIKLSILIFLFLWVYIVNINNFVDGADGFCVTNAFFFFLSVLFLDIYYELNLFSKFISILILPILFVFFFFNAPPAKMFMGDAGSIFLGFLIGYCIIELSFSKFYFYAFAAFAYPILDCSISLLKKTIKGYLPWKRLGDYYFLLPKKSLKKLNFVLVEKKIFYSIFILNVCNFSILLLSIYFEAQYLVLINFLNSFFLLLIYKRYRK